jgi:hypothetical protein
MTTYLSKGEHARLVAEGQLSGVTRINSRLYQCDTCGRFLPARPTECHPKSREPTIKGPSTSTYIPLSPPPCDLSEVIKRNRELGDGRHFFPSLSKSTPPGLREIFPRTSAIGGWIT